MPSVWHFLLFLDTFIQSTPQRHTFLMTLVCIETPDPDNVSARLYPWGRHKTTTHACILKRPRLSDRGEERSSVVTEGQMTEWKRKRPQSWFKAKLVFVDQNLAHLCSTSFPFPVSFSPSLPRLSIFPPPSAFVITAHSRPIVVKRKRRLGWRRWDGTVKWEQTQGARPSKT